MAKNEEKKYTAIGEKLAAENDGVQLSQMFGMPTLKVNGKAFAGYFNGEMIFKLTGEAHARALGLKGARLFDPMGTGRTMKEWVQVPGTFSGKWAAIAGDALEYVTKSAKAAPKKKIDAGKASKPKPKKETGRVQ